MGLPKEKGMYSTEVLGLIMVRGEFPIFEWRDG
jgi:hypothetical protein